MEGSVSSKKSSTYNFFFLLRRLTKLVCLCQREGERESLTKLVYMCVSRKTGKPPVTTPQRLVTTVETGLKFWSVYFLVYLITGSSNRRMRKESKRRKEVWWRTRQLNGTVTPCIKGIQPLPFTRSTLSRYHLKYSMSISRELGTWHRVPVILVQGEE